MRTISNFLISTSLAAVLIFSPVNLNAPRANAQVCNYPGCFNGVAVAQILCTCSGNFLTWFAPLNLHGNPVPITGPLVFQPGTMLHPNYWIAPSQGVVGTYAPGVQACWMYTGHSCVPIPNLGLILPVTGSSLPGGGVVSSMAQNIGPLVGGLSSIGGGSGGSGGGSGSDQDGHSQPSTYNDRIVISKGGTYSGNWESKDARYPAVEIRTSEPVIIENSHIRGKGTLINAEGVRANITIRNSYGYGLNPDVNMKVPGRFLFVGGFSNVSVTNNYMENTRGIDVHGRDGADGGFITIKNNKAKNIDGRLSGGPGVWRNEDIDVYYGQDNIIDVGDNYGQFVQLNGVTQSRVEIAWNEIVNEPYISRVEDVVSIYKSSGTEAQPINIHDNFIQGAYPVNPKRDTFSGGGIMAGDAQARNVLVKDNVVVAATNYGISATAGSNITIANNRVVTSSRLPDGTFVRYNAGGGNVGLVAYSAYGSALSQIHFANNVSGWTKANGERNDWYVPQATTFTNNSHYTSAQVGASGVITGAMEKAEYDAWRIKLQTSGITVGPAR